MRPIGNSTKLHLILGGGERLEGQWMRLRSLSATTSHFGTAVDKRCRTLRSAGTGPRPVVC